MSGHCGVRFGWAVVEDNSIYEKICEYMEFESGGLGYDTQKKACSIIDTLLNNSDWNDILSNIQKILYSRKLFISDLCEKNGWVYYKKPGMFAWISTKGNSLEELKNIGILGTCGSKCGGSTNQVRINLAVDTKTWDSLTEIFKNSL